MGPNNAISDILSDMRAYNEHILRYNFVYFYISFFRPNRKIPIHKNEQENMLTSKDFIRIICHVKTR
jgi:hypothetical protein